MASQRDNYIMYTIDARVFACVCLCRWSVRRAPGRTGRIHRGINVRVSLLQKENEPHRTGKNPWPMFVYQAVRGTSWKK